MTHFMDSRPDWEGYANLCLVDKKGKNIFSWPRRKFQVWIIEETGNIKSMPVDRTAFYYEFPKGAFVAGLVMDWDNYLGLGRKRLPTFGTREIPGMFSRETKFLIDQWNGVPLAWL